MLARQDETSSRRGGVGGNMYLLYHNQIANCKQPEAVAVALTLPLTLTVTLLAGCGCDCGCRLASALPTCAWLAKNEHGANFMHKYLHAERAERERELSRIDCQQVVSRQLPGSCNYLRHSPAYLPWNIHRICSSNCIRVKLTT